MNTTPSASTKPELATQHLHATPKKSSGARSDCRPASPLPTGMIKRLPKGPHSGQEKRHQSAGRLERGLAIRQRVHARTARRIARRYHPFAHQRHGEYWPERRDAVSG